MDDALPMGVIERCRDCRQPLVQRGWAGGDLLTPLPARKAFNERTSRHEWHHEVRRSLVHAGFDQGYDMGVLE